MPLPSPAPLRVSIGEEFKSRGAGREAPRDMGTPTLAPRKLDFPDEQGRSGGEDLPPHLVGDEPWHLLSLEQVENRLRTDRIQGLAPAALQERKRENLISPTGERAPSTTSTFLRSLWAHWLPLVLYLLGVLELIQSRWIEGGVLLGLGFLQTALLHRWSRKSFLSVTALESLLPSSCVVVRDGVEQEILSRECRLGDLVVLDPGDVVPADLILVTADGLVVDESFLTGRSDDPDGDAVQAQQSQQQQPGIFQTAKGDRPIVRSWHRRKEAGASNSPQGASLHSNMTYLPSRIVSGHGRGLVVGTGRSSQVGEAAAALHSVEEEAGVDGARVQSSRLVGFLLLVGFSFGLLTLVIRFIRDAAEGGRPSWSEARGVIEGALAQVFNVLPLSLLPVLVLGTSMALSRLGLQGVLLRHPGSLRRMAGVQTLVTDLTGTLSSGQKTLRYLWTPALLQTFTPETHAARDRALRRPDLQAFLQDPADPAVNSEDRSGLQMERRSDSVDRVVLREAPDLPLRAGLPLRKGRGKQHPGSEPGSRKRRRITRPKPTQPLQGREKRAADLVDILQTSRPRSWFYRWWVNSSLEQLQLVTAAQANAELSREHPTAFPVDETEALADDDHGLLEQKQESSVELHSLQLDVGLDPEDARDPAQHRMRGVRSDSDIYRAALSGNPSLREDLSGVLEIAGRGWHPEGRLLFQGEVVEEALGLHSFLRCLMVGILTSEARLDPLEDDYAVDPRPGGPSGTWAASSGDARRDLPLRIAGLKFGLDDRSWRAAPLLSAPVVPQGQKGRKSSVRTEVLELGDWGCVLVRGDPADVLPLCSQALVGDTIPIRLAESLRTSGTPPARSLGAAEEISLTPSMISHIREEWRLLQARGYRVEALAYRDIEEVDLETMDERNPRGTGIHGSLVLCGLGGIDDDLREGAAATLARARDRQGLRFLVMSGEGAPAVHSLGQRLGLIGVASAGPQADLEHLVALDGLEPEVTDEPAVESVRVWRGADWEAGGVSLQSFRDSKSSILFAETAPEQKQDILESFTTSKSEGVGPVRAAVIGEGVQDAQAQKYASVSVAAAPIASNGLVSPPTIASLTADVALDPRADGIWGLLWGLEEARRSWKGLQNACVFLAICSLSWVWQWFVLGVSANQSLPVTQMMHVWNSFVVLFPVALTMTMDPLPHGFLDRPSADPKLLPRSRWWEVFGQSALLGILGGVILAIGLRVLDHDNAHPISGTSFSGEGHRGSTNIAALHWTGMSCLMLALALVSRNSVLSLEQHPLLLLGVTWGFCCLFIPAYIPGVNRFLQLKPVSGWGWITILLTVVGFWIIQWGVRSFIARRRSRSRPRKPS